MMKLLSVIALMASLQSCFTPVNLNYDSARMLQKNAVEVQGSASAYTINGSVLTNYNAGIKVGYGFSEHYNLKLRAELIFPNNWLIEDETIDLFFSFRTTYFELDNKIGFNKNLALSLPIGFYYMNGSEELEGFFTGSFDPRLYATFPTRNNKFEFSIIPKCHFMFYSLGVDGGTPLIMPGISAGFGFSNNLDSWAIRPEIGYDRFLSFGIGFNYNFGNI